MNQRIKYYEWIDILKGIGIFSVVVGHIYDCRYVFMFHMPLFFILSGYTYRHTNDIFYVIKNKARRLLLPYLSFIIVLTLPNIYHCFKTDNFQPIFDIVYGGTKLGGIIGPFWFLTVLFFSILFYSFLFKYINSYWKVLLLSMISYVFTYTKVELPFGLEIVPMAITYMWIGYIIKKKKEIIVKIRPYAISLLFIGLLFSSYYIDMKYSSYGIPIISILVSVVMVIGWLCISLFLENKVCAKPLIILGNSSLIIMCLHQYIHYKYVYLDKWIILILCLIIPIVVKFFLNHYKITRLLFLGNK